MRWATGMDRKFARGLFAGAAVNQMQKKKFA